MASSTLIPATPVEPASAHVFTQHGFNTIIARYNDQPKQRDNIARVLFQYREAIRMQFFNQLTSDSQEQFNTLVTYAEEKLRQDTGNDSEVVCALTGRQQLPQDNTFSLDDVNAERLTALLADQTLTDKFCDWVSRQDEDVQTAFRSTATTLPGNDTASLLELIDNGEKRGKFRGDATAYFINRLCSSPPPVRNAPPPTFQPIKAPGMQSRHMMTGNTSKCGGCCSGSKKPTTPNHLEAPTVPKKTGWFGWW